jgi:hypothetical protein
MSYSYREVALNWLALGMLLAAWNASDDTGASRDPLSATGAGPERPAALRAYPKVSVRAATRTAVIDRGFTVM